MALDMAAVICDRITFRPPGAKLAPIPWPAGLAPEPLRFTLSADGSLPPADVLVITWTQAEGMALADVLTPGHGSATWTAYVKNFGMYVHMLTGRSPARESQRLGSASYTRIAGKTVCCLKSELHPATDGIELPTAAMVSQVLADTGAGLVITTGTAGGAGGETVLGDVNVATGIHADFTTKLKGRTWSQQMWGTAILADKQREILGGAVLPELFAANGGHLPPDYAPRPPVAWFGHVVSTDFFAYDTTDDHYGLRAYDPEIRAVEMDDAAVAVGADGRVPVLSVRNASDPVMPDASEASSKEAASIYQRFGYFTTANSAICVWALIAGME
jgi:nucleoside phosphorylase